jgi:hypothetical protein
VLPALGLAPQAAQQLVFLIREGEAKALRDFLRDAVMHTQGTPGGAPAALAGGR